MDRDVLAGRARRGQVQRRHPDVDPLGRNLHPRHTLRHVWGLAFRFPVFGILLSGFDFQFFWFRFSIFGFRISISCFWVHPHPDLHGSLKSPWFRDPGFKWVSGSGFRVCLIPDLERAL